MSQTEKHLILKDHKDWQTLCGRHDQNLKLIEKELNVRVSVDNGGIKIVGEQAQVDQTSGLFDYLIKLLEAGSFVKTRDVFFALKVIKNDKGIGLDQFSKSNIEVPARGMIVTPKTPGQVRYIEAIKQKDVVFGIGPAGTGKTYLAMAMAVNALKKGLVKRIVLTRPAIEAGESLGFLPGDMAEKVSPYLRPLYDALYDMLESEKVDQYRDQGIIEVAPLAFMRGRTLNDSFIILDEAQNCSVYQMKMFLTRLGFDSKMVVTGDVTQSDLPQGTTNGLMEAPKVLKGIEGIDFVYLTSEDVVRHALVQRVIEAYEKYRS